MVFAEKGSEEQQKEKGKTPSEALRDSLLDKVKASGPAIGQPSLDFSKPIRKTSASASGRKSVLALDEDLSGQIAILKDPGSSENDKINALHSISSIFSSVQHPNPPNLTSKEVDDAYSCMSQFLKLQTSQPLLVGALDALTNGLYYLPAASLNQQPVSDALASAVSLFENYQDNAVKEMSIRLVRAAWGRDMVPAGMQQEIASNLVGWYESSPDSSAKLGILWLAQAAMWSHDVPASSKSAIALKLPGWYDSESEPQIKRALASLISGVLENPVAFGTGHINDGIASRLAGWFESAQDDGLREDLLYCLQTALSSDGSISSYITNDTRSGIMESMIGWVEQEKYPALQGKILSVFSNILFSSSDYYLSESFAHPISLDGIVSQLAIKLASQVQRSEDATSTLNYLMAFAGASVSKPTLENLSNTARSIALAGDGGMNKLAGGLLARTCFAMPELFDRQENLAIFSLDSKTAVQMSESAPSWSTDPLLLKIEDLKMIYRLGRQNPNVPAIKTLFELNNITHFGFYPIEILQHNYDNRDRLTGKQLYFVTTTKRSSNGVPFARYLEASDAQDFDVRIIEPGNETKLRELVLGMAQRLGIRPNYETTDGPKVEFVGMNGHGDPSVIQMAIVPGKPAPTPAAPVKRLGKITGPDNGYIDVTDTELLRFIGQYCRKPDIILQACSTAGVLPSGENIAEVIARNIGGRAWGASDFAGGELEIKKVRGADGKTSIDRVVMQADGTTSYDYRELASLQMPVWNAKATASGVRFEWKAANAQNTENYEIERSTDGGKNFERVALVDKQPDNTNYAFESSSEPSGKALYRIKQRNASAFNYVTPTYFKPMFLKDYTFAASTPKEAGPLTGVEEGSQRPAAFELMQNYPNPFNAQTTIRYSIPDDRNVTVTIYNVLGQRVVVPLDNQQVHAGTHNISLDASRLASGTYFFEIVAGRDRAVKKMTLVK